MINFNPSLRNDLMSSWLFFADTPLQAYNAYLMASSFDSSSTRCDLLIYGQFKNADKAFETYQETGVFNDIVLCPPSETKTFKALFAWQLFAPYGSRKLEAKLLDKRQYSHFALACPTPASMEAYSRLQRQNPFLKTVFYEDGTGTYNGEVFLQPFLFDKPPSTQLKCHFSYIRIIQKILSALPSKQQRALYHPTALYVKQPSLLQYAPDIPVRRLECNLKAAAKLSDLMNDTHLFQKSAEPSLIFLDPLRNELEHLGSKTIDDLIESSLAAGLSCHIRQHPRTTQPSPYLSSCTNISGGLWELKCRTHQLSESTLISIASTAMLAPLFETGQKPYLIFLFDIALDHRSREYDLCKKTLNLAKAGYGDSQDRIYVPQSKQEAIEVIRKNC